MHENQSFERELRDLYQNYHNRSQSALKKDQERIKLLQDKMKRNQSSCSHSLGISLKGITYCAFCNQILPPAAGYQENIKVANYPEMLLIEQEIMNILLVEPENLTSKKLINEVRKILKEAKIQR